MEIQGRVGSRLTFFPEFDGCAGTPGHQGHRPDVVGEGAGGGRRNQDGGDGTVVVHESVESATEMFRL